MSVPAISSFFEPHLSILEKYWLSSDKQQYLESLTNQTDKKLISLLINPLPENHDELFKQLKIPSNVRSELINSKLLSAIRNADNEQAKAKALEKYTQEYLKNMTFDYPKPPETLSFTQETGTTQETKLKEDNSTLTLRESLPEYLEELIEKHKDNFQTLDEFGIKQLSEQWLLNMHIDNRRWLIGKSDILVTFRDEFVVKLVLSYAQQVAIVKKVPFYQEISDSTIQSLSKTQVNLLKSQKSQMMNNPTFVRIWFELNYLKQIEEEPSAFKVKSTISELDERRKKLLAIREEIKKVGSNLLKPYESHLFYQILVLDLKRQDPHKELFFQFLANVEGLSSFFNKDYRESLKTKYGYKSLSNYSSIRSQLILSANYNADKLIGNYLQKLFKKYKNVEELKESLNKYLDFKIVDSHYAKVKLEEGEELSNLHDLLLKHEIQELKKTKEITILTEKTEKFFKAQDDVVLAIRLKNIKQMKLKVYEMNMEQFYLENPNQSIDETINLQYLNPTHEELIQIKDFKNSCQVIEQELLVDKIPKTCGFYIVELVGEGITSRAVIRKGAIACFESSHIDGKLLKFYDELGNPVNNIKVWVNGRSEVLADAEYLVPFSKKGDSLKVLAVRDTYAEIFNVYLDQEIYSFEVGLIYNHESFIVGKKSKIILHPVLKLGGKNISLLNMQNIKVTANLVNNQNIKSSERFQNIKFSDDKDYVLEVPIKSYTKSIGISVEGEIKDLEGKVINLNFNKTISIELMEGTTNFIDMYLNRSNKGKQNTLKVKGFNGEAIANMDVNLFLRFQGTSQTLDKMLKTNTKGELNLGNLSYVSFIKATINTSFGNVSRSWKLTSYIDEIAFGGTDLVYHEESDIVIPLPFDWGFDQKNIRQFLNFYKQTHNETAQNLIDTVKVVIEGAGTYLALGKLPAGNYVMNFLKIANFGINIRTLEGKVWANGAIFSEKLRRVQNINQSPSLFVSLGEMSEEKGQTQGTKKLSIPIGIPQIVKESIDKKAIRLHILLKNNSDSIDGNISNAFRLDSFNARTQLRSQQISYKLSNYYNNKTLSDEQAYVLNRQNQKQFIGNNLEKPRIFLKRIEVRDTTESEEQLNVEGGYRAESDMLYGAPMYEKAQKMHRAKARMMNDSCAGGRGYSTIEYNLNSHNNFFGLSGHSLLNSKYNQRLEFIVPSGYSEVTVYLISDSAAIRKSYYLNDQTNESKKDLKHPGLKDANEQKGWSMSRQIYQLQKGEKRQISRDSLWCTVSLSNILQFAQIKGHKLPLWVSQWKSYSQAKKLQVYDKQVCHQLNVYIKHQDVQFFKTVVEPFIRNKITKTFVDQCLLSDKAVLEYVAPHKMRNLNEFEKVLLVQILVENGKKQEAGEVAASMELQQKSVKRSFEVYKELFDIVLNSQAGSAKQKVPLINQSSSLMGDAAFSNFAFSAPPMAMMSMAPSNQMYIARSFSPEFTCQKVAEQQCMMLEECEDDDIGLERICGMKSAERMIRGGNDRKRDYKPGFKEVQKTKEYTETTYAGMKNPAVSKSLVPQNLFWAHIATHLASGTANSFLSEAFLYFSLPIEFTLAASFLSSEPNADYQLNNQGDNFVIQANNSFMLFVKEVKELQYADKFGVMINQRFFNPLERYAYEDDGTQIEKLVDEFLVKKVYTLQTVVTNTSGTNLELQLLMDVPSGAIPLMSHEYVQIINANVNSFSTTSFERHFYFPSEGTYTLYPANASRNNIVIAKAKKLPSIQVKLSATVNKLESFSDVMRSGSRKDILEYIEKRNIFDQKIFTPFTVYWMFKEKEFYEEAIKVLRRRNFFDSQIWSFSIYHKDQRAILQYIESTRQQNGLKLADVPIFEYFPYFSRRTHKFMDENKSTIRNIQFKQTYNNFIINSLLEGQTSSAEKTAFAYYLLLQDKIDECSAVFKTLSGQERKAHEIQTDYLACYLSMYQDYPNFTTAQSISQKYQTHPISTWHKMFKQIFDTLKEYHSEIELHEQTLKRPATDFRTTFVNDGDHLKVNVPSSTKVEVYFYDINLELYFSDYPFAQVQSLSVVKPKQVKAFESGSTREERIAFEDVQHLGNMIVEIYEFKEGVPALKIGSFFWANPKVKVKISQNQGTLQVFYDGKKQTGCYVKVYSTGNKGNKFYRDGYTDITGKFKYVLADLEGLTKFSILAITKQGGVINQVSPPSTAGYF